MSARLLTRTPRGILLVLLSAVAVAGCTVPPVEVERSEGLKEALEDPPLPYQVKIELVVVREGTTEESEQAEMRLKYEFKHAALPWLGAELEEKLPKEVEERFTDIMVAILLTDASSPHQEYRKQAVEDLVSLDKRFGVIDQLLLRLETADQNLSNSIYQVLERREYISGKWSWPDQVWDELSVRFGGNIEVMKRYIVYKLSDLPKFDTRTMNWDDYDSEYSFTVLSEVAVGEHYTSLAPLFAGMLDAFAPRVRRQAARVLGFLGYREAIGELTTMLTEDPSESVRASAAEALGRIGAEEEAATALVVMLRRGELLGSSICWALGEMRSQKAVRALNQIVDNPAAMIALGKIGNELAVKPLIRTMESSTNPRVRAVAAHALGNFKASEVTQALKRAFAAETEHTARSQMLFSAFMLDPKPHKAGVEAYVHDYDVNIRVTAMILLFSEGFMQDSGMAKTMQLLEGLSPGSRVWLWEKLKGSFEGIPEYHPYGLTHQRTADIEAINKWFQENKPRFSWDSATKKFKVK